MSDILISGYHGFSNSGDEALLWAILQALREKKPDINVTVLSKNPRETAVEYGVESVYRYNIFKIYKTMKKTKMLLFGGGSLLQDATSSKSIRYYLAILWLAQKCGLKTMLYANGIGPITKKTNRAFASKILNRTDVITLRDDNSDEELKSLGVTKPLIKITADPVFTIDVESSLSGSFFIKRAEVPDGTRFCVVSVREWQKAINGFEEIIANLCDYLYNKYNIASLFVPMQYPTDMEISRRIIDKMQTKAYLISRELSVPEMFSVLSESEMVIGMRLHSLIYATTLEKPALALSYDPKISAFMKSIAQPDNLDVETIELEKALATLDKIVDNREDRCKILAQTNHIMRTKARENADYAINLIRT